MLGLSLPEALLAFLVPKFKAVLFQEDALLALAMQAAGEEETVENPVIPADPRIIGRAILRPGAGDAACARAKAELPARPGSTTGRGNLSPVSRASPRTNRQHLLPGDLRKAPISDKII